MNSKEETNFKLLDECKEKRKKQQKKLNEDYLEVQGKSGLQLP